MSKKLLVTRPNYDPTTNYLYFWTELVLKIAQKHKIGVLDLCGNKASSGILNSYLQSKKPEMVFFNGHGDVNLVTGQDNEVLIQAGAETKILTGTVVYIRSCNCGKILGPNLIKNGVKAFVGYTRKFLFVTNTKYETKPLKDPVAGLFLEPSNLIATTLIKGHNAKEAYSRSTNSMWKNFHQSLSSTATYEQKSISFALWSNIKGQVLLGDEYAVI